mmetsp:Transcript_12127/g.25673  ORF Transcript_12127/g.25673 Transcript_12127/m.25673 type:complete len:445 (+) Transcript_12127:144-1478(+)
MSMVGDNDANSVRRPASSLHQKHGLQRNDGNSDSTNIFHNDDENTHFQNVCSAYRQYASFAMARWTSHEYRLKALPDSQQKLLPAGLKFGTAEYSKRYEEYRNAVIRNQFCLDCILRHAGQPHSQQQQQQQNNGANSANSHATDEQMSKVSSVLKSLTRDWSAYGEAERRTAYDPVVAAVRKYLPLRPRGQEPPRIVVPGSGVGRLAFDLAATGYSVQGNEYSMYMLLASDFVLNNGGRACTPERPLRLSPWLLELRNVHSSTDPLRAVRIPDADPAAMPLPPGGDASSPAPEFSMAAGEFAAIYGDEAEQWDCVASCFFLDACPNIVELSRVIYEMLKPGGLFVNLGPLLYHWSGPPMRPDDKSVGEYRRRHEYLDDRYLTSIDLSYDDVREILIAVGFEILEEETGIECYYTADRCSMMSTKYECVKFVARKRTIARGSDQD